MEIEGAQTGQTVNLAGKQTEGHYHKEVGVNLFERINEFGVLHLYGLKYGNAVRYGKFFHGAFVYLHSSSGGLVGHGHDGLHSVSCIKQGFQGSNGKVRCTHIYYICFAEQVEQAEFDFGQKHRYFVFCYNRFVLDGFVGEEGADGSQYVGGYEGSGEGVNGSVAGQFCGDYVHDII